jgi:cytoskeletal protein CcmA (bactofilin family)
MDEALPQDGGQDMLVSWIGFPLGAGVALGLLAGLAPPSQAHAAEFRSEKDGTVTIDAGETIDDTVFLSGQTVVVAGVVEGDVFAAAEQVEITGTVRGNLYCGGRKVTIGGEIAGNVHAGGKDLELSAKVGGSGFLGGQNVVLTEGSELARGGYLAGESVRAQGRVGRDLYFGAEKMEIGGSVERSVHGYAGQFAVSSGGSVGGDVNVTVPAEDAAKIDEGATVSGATVIDVEAEKKERRAFLYPGFYLGVLAQALALLVIGLVLVTLFPSLLPPAPESGKEALRNMGIGLIILLATPVAMLFIALTVIGIPVSIVLAMAYALLLYTSTLVVAYFLALRLPATNNRRLVVSTALSLLVILLVVKVPLVGPGLRFLVHLLGMGCLVMHLRNLYVASRDSATGPTGQVGTGQPGVLATE